MNNEHTHEYGSTRQESFSYLLGKLAENSADLVKNEISLAKHELREDAERIKTGAITIGIGASLGLLSLMALCAALIFALSHFMSIGWSAFVVGIVLAITGGAVTYYGITLLKEIKPENSEGSIV